MSEGNGLPEGWIEASLGEVTHKKVEQGSPVGHTFSYIDIGAIDRTTKSITDIEPQPSDKAPSRAKQKVKAGDVLISMTRPNLNAVAMVPDSLRGGTASTGFDVLRPITVQSAWLFAHVRSKFFVDEMTKLVQGALYPAVKSGDVRASRIPIPPLNEQRRIVTKIEALQERSDAAKEALDAIPPLLERFRQSVLAAAFRGDLTKDWRAKNPNVEPASRLLERIRKERKARFIAMAAEKARARAEAKATQAGKPWTAADNETVLAKERAKAEKKYKAPEPVDTTALPDLPEGWCWAAFGEVFHVAVGATPSRREPSYWGGPVPWVSSGEVAFCRIDSTRETITNDGLRNTSTELHPPGTVLLGMIGEGKTRGQAAILDIEACNNQNCAAIRVSETGIPPEYIYRLLEGEYARTRRVGSGNNQKALNKTRVQQLRIPLAPLAEMRELSVALESRLEVVDSYDAALQDSQQLLPSLNQSILAKAFRGELVPQDPSDEPASVLLERIRAERAQAEAEKKGRKGKRAKVSSASTRRGRPRKKPSAEEAPVEAVAEAPSRVVTDTSRGEQMDLFGGG